MPQIREEHREATRRRLLDAAAEVVFERGTDQATTREILKRAGLSAGALYHYFPSKEALYEEVARYQIGVTGAEPPPFDTMPAAELAALLVYLVAAMFDPERRSVTPQLRTAGLHRPAIAEGLARYDAAAVAQVGALNQAAVAAGLYRADVDVDALTEMVGTFVEGYWLRAPVGAFATDRAAVVRLYLEMVSDRLLDTSSEHYQELRANLLAIPDAFEGAAA
jgi:AcrR family transcriptional regulator